MNKVSLIALIFGVYVWFAPSTIHAVETKKTESQKPSKEEKNTALDEQWKTHIVKKHEVFLTWLSKNYPAKYKQLSKKITANPESFTDQIGKMIEIYEPIRRAQKNNPKLAKLLKRDLLLQQQRDQLLAELRNAQEPDKEDLLKQFTEVVSNRFDVLIQKKIIQLENLRNRLERLKKDLDKREVELETMKTKKQANVEQRTKDLLKNSGVSWQ